MDKTTKQEHAPDQEEVVALPVFGEQWRMEVENLRFPYANQRRTDPRVTFTPEELEDCPF